MKYNLECAKNTLKKLQTKEVTGNNRKSLKSRLNIILTELYNNNIDIEFLAIDYDIIKSIDVYKNRNNNKNFVIVRYENCYNFNN